MYARRPCCTWNHRSVSVHLLACACTLQRADVFFAHLQRASVRVQCVSQWPAAPHRAYLWVWLARIHPLKSAFYSVSHKQIPAWSVHFQNHSITSLDLSSTSVDLHFFFFFLLPGGSCKATHLCEQCATRLHGCVSLFISRCCIATRREIFNTHTSFCENLCVFIGSIYSKAGRLVQTHIQRHTRLKENGLKLAPPSLSRSCMSLIYA